MTFIVAVSLLVIGMWLHARARSGFLVDVAELVDRPELVDDFANRWFGRSFVKGEFRGRKVVIRLQVDGRNRPRSIVVSMETNVHRTMETYDFAGYRADREGELALFALEVKHDVRLRHEDRCLKAQAVPEPFGFFFPGQFDTAKWQSVLEGMHTLARSIEQKTGVTPAISGAPADDPAAASRSRDRGLPSEVR